MVRSRPLRVLLVEDNKDDVAMTRRTLAKSKLAHELFVARDGEEALRFLFNEGRFRQAGQPDVVVLGVNLPKLTGLEVLEKIRATERLASTPIIVLTTSVRDEDVASPYHIGSNTYVRKQSNVLKTIEILAQYWGIGAQMLPAA